jgi:hypothetical protein
MPPLMMRFLKPKVLGVLTSVNTPVLGVVAPSVPLSAPDVELNVPVTAAPADVMETMVVVPLLMSKLPLVSTELICTPPTPAVNDDSEFAIMFPL